MLRGVFSDEHGDYPEGTYVRNPVGSAHTPRIGPRGCLIFVKLWWMHPEDDERVVVDTHDPARWRQTPYGARLDLFESPRERVALLRLAPGQTWAPRGGPGRRRAVRALRATRTCARPRWRATTGCGARARIERR